MLKFCQTNPKLP